VIFAMVKITLAVPFLWLVLFAPSGDEVGRAWPFRLRPALLAAAGYVALTVVAASFQQPTLLLRLREWLRLAGVAGEGGGDYANLSAWLNDAGLARLGLAAAALVFIALGAWLYRYRRVDLWVRLGVVAIVARVWTYHRLYDDVLVVLAFVALFRIAMATGDDARDRRVFAVAAALVATSMLFMLLPARLGTSAAPWRQIFDLSHASTWFGMLAFLGWYATRTGADGSGSTGGGRGRAATSPG
jgi:hypothetical protein